MEIENTVAVVTGAGGGIGGAIARALAARGARVVVTDLDEASVAVTAADIEKAGGSARALAGDAASQEHIEAVIAAAAEAFGPVDLYVANAGIGGRGGIDATDADWERAIDINLMGHVRAARLLVPDWVERGRGYFLSTASAAGLLTQLGSATYSVTKHAAVGFAEWLSASYGDRGVRVSCLCPMGVDTKLLRPEAMPDDPNGDLMQRAVETAGEVLTVEEVAEVVLAAIDDERFLILPHPEVLEMYRRKGADYDRWLRGMRRFQASLLS
ncbi:SDR family oxidoreductase [Gordonia desulfuricans]|uniref:SDR family oxidoreductase n=1 Tax=Gordonia desulfuricans TaxID=89051 RepID=A0A7K3LPR3_9ACTN|nr:MULTISPECIES: SDR family oxidoreductase [Gordonia]KOY49393.1 dehydrogenase [Gordonia sp. NB41Y]NDK90223.1 SDR family oxidoreductase [Gordonia desulfuricans]WLP91663.1 SDR family oxidoreductase [Gordonia sp. NB41Y]